MGFLFAKRLYKDGDTEGWQKTFYSCFLLKQNDVVLKQKDGVLKESPLSFFSRTKNEVRVREKKLNGLS